MITIKLNPVSESILKTKNVEETVGGIYSNHTIPTYIVTRRWDAIKYSFFEIVKKVEQLGNDFIVHTDIELKQY